MTKENEFVCPGCNAVVPIDHTGFYHSEEKRMYCAGCGNKTDGLPKSNHKIPMPNVKPPKKGFDFFRDMAQYINDLEKATDDGVSIVRYRIAVSKILDRFDDSMMSTADIAEHRKEIRAIIRGVVKSEFIQLSKWFDEQDDIRTTCRTVAAILRGETQNMKDGE